MAMGGPWLARIASKVRSLNQVKEVHARIISQSLHHQTYWISLLIRQCTLLLLPHAPPLSYARRLFNSLPHPDVFVFTAILRFYYSSGSHQHVLSLYHNCPYKDAFLYPIFIKSAGKDALPLHALVLKLGHAFDPYVRNAVMDNYAKYWAIHLAEKLFDEMPERAVADWNSMISGYWKWGYSQKAFKLFNSMPQRNVVSWTAMVSGYAKLGDLDNARRLFDEMPERSVVSWNAMLSGYAQNGLAERTIELFEEMMDSGMKPNETTWVTIISSCSERGDPHLAKSLVGSLEQRKINLNSFVKTALIDMYAKCGDLATAKRVFDEMGAQKNPVSWNAMISGFARTGDLTSARKLFSEMPEKNVVSWNSMITGYAQNGQSATAVELFKEMTVTKHIEPDEVTMVSVISACGHLGALELGKWVMKFIFYNHINLSIAGYNALISMYSRCGSMEDAKRIFQEMPTRDVVSYNSLIAGFAAHGYGTEASQLMFKMKGEGIEPDRITFLGVLTACSHAGLLAQGQEIFKSIRTPAVDHYSCMVDLLGRAGKIDEAKTLIEGMSMAPHAGAYGALLNASRIHKRVDIGELAGYKLFDLEPENSGNYVLLSNIYASAGRWQDVDRVREAMRVKGVKKTTAFSWVEFGGTVHRFIAGDQSHEQLPQIYRTLKELGEKMKNAGYLADKSCVLRDVEEEEKEEMVGTHSEKLAIGFALLVSEAGTMIRVVKNLRVCGDCHVVIKMLSKLTGREISVRDNNRFHHFKDGECSCMDYW